MKNKLRNIYKMQGIESFYKRRIELIGKRNPYLWVGEEIHCLGYISNRRILLQLAKQIIKGYSK